MKRQLLLLLAVFQIVTLVAQKKNPKWMETVNKAIFTVETTTKEGMTKTGPGFLVHENGEVIAAYELFRKAEKAVVIMPGGERLPVTHILGADDMYNVIRFKVVVPKKTIFLTVAKGSPEVNATVYLPPSKEEKNFTQGVISEITKMNGTYDYFKIEMSLPQSQVGFPLLTETGEVFALTQSDASGKGNTYGLSIAYIQNLQTAATDMFNRTYAEIGIRNSWSSSFEEAQISLLLYSSQQDAPTYLETISDFIATFPNNTEGYISRAAHYAYMRKELTSNENEQLQMLDKALNDLESAAKLTKIKGEGNFQKAKLIFGVVANDSTLTHKNFNLKTAEELIQKAIKEGGLPRFRQLEGDIAFFQNDFKKAYNSFEIVNNSPDANGSSYYLAAKCKQQLEEPDLLEIISLLDSAIAKSPDLEAADFLLENIDLKLELNLYDQAIKDYDKYWMIMSGKVSDAFYYYREQAKLRTNDLEGALKDINMAIVMDNKNALYFAEQASIYLRQYNYPKAQESVEKALLLDPEFASAYRILGVCLARQGDKAEACKHFFRAKELGDPVVERLIKENCNE